MARVRGFGTDVTSTDRAVTGRSRGARASRPGESPESARARPIAGGRTLTGPRQTAVLSAVENLG